MAIATFFAPALWLLNTPDRFDVYSLGITFLQLCFSATRTNDAIIAFNETLKENYKYDLQAWRDDEEKRGRPDFDDGFKLLDAGNGAGWDLLKRMLQEQPGARPSATEILRSPFLKGSDLPSRAAARRQALGPRILQAVKDALGNAVREGLWGRGSGLSEAQLDRQPAVDGEAPVSPTGDQRPALSQTQAWWAGRRREVTIASRPPTMLERISDRWDEVRVKEKKEDGRKK